MNIVFVTQQDPFYLPLFFKNFFKLYNQNKSGINIKGVVIQPPLGKESKFKLVKQIYNLYRPINFLKQAARYFKSKVNYILYKLKLKKDILAIPSIVKKNGVKILPYSDVNTREFIKFIEENNIDLVISVSATQIFNKEVLEAPNLACINIHSSPLPKYRGMMPNFWQMYYDEDYSVLTIHKMVEKLDRGEIIYQYNTKIEEDMTLEELVCQTKVNAAQALWKVLNQFKTEEVNYTPLPEEEGSYFSFPTREDAEEFRARGNKLL